MRGLEAKSLCLLIILRPVLGLTPILFERFPETLQQITPPVGGYSVATCSGIVEIKSEKKH